MTLFALALEPFTSYEFMSRALMASWAVAIVGAPIGVMLMFRRLSLVGDALSHSLLPGAAVGYLFAGLYFPALFLGGLVAGLLVAGLASLIAHITPQKEESSLASMYLLALASGVILISRSGSSVDLLHLLFGSVLALDDLTFQLVLASCVIALILMFCFGRALLFEALDPQHLARQGFPVRRIHFLFLFLVVLTLVTGFQALGTLMALGLVLIPASAARFMVDSLVKQIAYSVLFGMIASYVGLLLSYHINWPSGPAIVLACGGIYVLSFCFGPTHGLINRFRKPKHRAINHTANFSISETNNNAGS